MDRRPRTTHPTPCEPGTSSRGRTPLIAVLLAAPLMASCDPVLPAPVVDGVLWYTDSRGVACGEELPGDYLPTVVTRVSAQRCVVPDMLFGCHEENVSRSFSIVDGSTNDPGPWWRHGRQYIDLYDHNLGHGRTLFSGTGQVSFDELYLHVWSSDPYVEASAGLFTPLSDIQNERITLGEVDRFSDPRTTTTTPTYELPIDDTFEPRVSVWGYAHGESAGLPFLVSSGWFRANGTVTADYTVCQEVRLVNHEDQCIGGGGTVEPFGHECGQFGSGVGVHVHRDSGALVLLSGLECLTVDDTRAIGGRFPVEQRPCSSGVDDMQQWEWLADGTFRPSGARGYCLAPDAARAYTYVDFHGHSYVYEPLSIQPCSGTDAERWRFY